MNLFLYTYVIAFLLSFCLGCSRTEKKEETATSGNISIVTDDSFYPILNSEAEAFQNIYTNTKINLESRSQDDAIVYLLNGTCDMILVGRELNAKEKAFIKDKKITVGVNKIASDAITLVVNDTFPDSVITMDQLREIFNGYVKKWNQLNPNFPEEDIQIVVDKSSSGNLSYLKNRLNLQTHSVKIYASGSNLKVLDYLRESKVGLGIVGVNWISDDDDRELKRKLQNLKVLSVAENSVKSKESYYQPLQENLWEHRYPLTRSVYAIYKTEKTGVGTGFVSYLLSDPGQRIILKEGLLPAIMPGREISIIKK